MAVSDLNNNGSHLNLSQNHSVESPLKVGNINLYGMQKIHFENSATSAGPVMESKQQEGHSVCGGGLHRFSNANAYFLSVHQQQSSVSPIQPVWSRNQSAANILEQVIKRLEKLQSH
jgi:hypothetical protein